ncbi:MacS family sensor histidine kinase [Thalassiella azotivora]
MTGPGHRARTRGLARPGARRAGSPDGAFGTRLRPGDDDFGLVTALWRGVDVFRVASLAYAVLTFVLTHGAYRRPVAAAAVLVGMGVWTGYVWLRRSRPGRLVVADLVVSVAAVLSTRWVDDVTRVGEGASTLPLTWPAASVLAWAVWRGWWGGVLAAAAVGAADLVVVDPVNGRTVHNIVLLLLAGAVVGYAAGLYRRSRRALAEALRVEAAVRERERLARDIHDSVLQVLAHVQRRGARLGGEAADLGRLAGEQEVLLRHLVTGEGALAGRGPGPGPGPGRGLVDLRAAVRGVSVPRAEVAAPAHPVPVPVVVAEQLAAAVAAALDNVDRHAGDGARAWVLVEQEPAAVVVTVRDDGVGMTAGRQAEAAREGRLGLASSVRGRVRDVGGVVAVTSSPGTGTEVEMRVPLPA